MKLRVTSTTSAREILGVAFLSLFVDSTGYGIVVPILSTYVLSLGASDFDLALIFSAFAIVQLITTIPFGLLSDRYGRRRFMIVGMILLAASFLYYPFAKSVLTLVACRAVQGLAASATWSSALALVADTYPGSDKGEKLGIANGAVGMGSVAGPVVGGILGGINFGLPFFILGSIALAAALYMIARLHLAKKEPVEASIPYRKMLGRATRVRNVLIVVGINSMIAIFFGFTEPLMPPYLHGRFFMPSSEIGLFFGVAFLTFAVFQPIVGRLSDRYGRKVFIVSGLVALSVLSPLIPYASSVPLLFLILGITGIFWALAFSPLMPLAVDSLRSKKMESFGTASGLFNIAYTMGYSIGPMLGVLITSYFGFESIFWVFSGILVIMIIITQILIIEKGIFTRKLSKKDL
ncbi:MAG: MFS transporter [Candidatus Freyarchaeum deiterrae]